MFGYLKTPLLIKAEEIIDDVINDSKIFRDNFSNSSDFILDPNLLNNTQYIWLIDKDGFLCIGIEKSKNGHPTLTNGMPARIGGEIKPILESNGKYTWKINSKSGRYSSDYDIEDQKKYLNNAIMYKFKLIFPSVHMANLINSGILPMTFANEADYDAIDVGDELAIENARRQISTGSELMLENKTKNTTIRVKVALSERQIQIMLAGGLLNYTRHQST